MITPQDIAEKEFRMSFRGYNTEDVDNFLQEVYDCFDEIYNSNQDLKEKTGRLSDAVGQYKSMEDTLNNALNIAGKSADEIEDCANEKAAEIIRNAEITAQSIIAGAEQKIRAEEYRLENIKRETELYKEKIIQLLNAQLSLLDGYPIPSGSMPVKENSAAENLSDIDVSDIKKEKNQSEKSDDNGKKKKRDKANRKNLYDTEKTAVVNDIKKDIAANTKIADEDETLRFPELNNTENIKKSDNSDKVDESYKEKSNNKKSNNKKSNKDFILTESKTEDKTESKNTKSEKDFNNKKSKNNDFDTVLNNTEDTNLNQKEVCEEVSDDTVIIQSIGADLNGDTSTLPFVAPNENGGYTVQNQ